MAVHVPLSKKAVTEARELMLSTRNLLKPSSGDPIVGPTKDMVLGCFYLTMERETLVDTADGATPPSPPAFADMEEVRLAHELGKLSLHAPIRLRYRSWVDNKELDYFDLSDEVVDALRQAGFDTAGRVLDVMEAGRLKAVTGLGKGDEQEIRDMLEAVGYQPEDRSATR
jgi:DNA-directed RNA polymerase subunit beta'